VVIKLVVYTSNPDFCSFGPFISCFCDTNMGTAPHSLSVWIAAAAVPPVAITGSRSSARLAAAVFDFVDVEEEEEMGRAKGRLL
jgi:hypothetical protein